MPRFFHQIKNIGKGRLPDRISTCIRNFSSAYEHAEVLHSTDISPTTLEGFLTWSKGPVTPEEIWSNLPFPRNTHIDINILTVTVNVCIRDTLEPHPVPNSVGFMDGRLDSWIATTKDRKPDKIVLLLLVDGMEQFLPWAFEASALPSQTDAVYAIHIQVMEIFKLFGGIHTRFPNEYLMVWDSPQFNEHVLDSLAARFPPSARMKRHDTLVSTGERWDLICCTPIL